MTNVYFVNCLLACLLAYIAGYYMAHRKWATAVANMARQQFKIVQRTSTNVTSDDSDVTKH